MGDVVGYWISEKKRQKFNWKEFEDICAQEGLFLKMINIESDLESQGPIHVFFHKLTDILSHAEDDDKCAKAIITRVRNYLLKHPDTIVIDPLDNVKNLRNRHKSYQIIQNGLQFEDHVFIPNFVEIKSKNISEIMKSFKENGVRFPCVCKTLIAHGSSDAHKLMVIFNEEGLLNCQIPCVAQNLVNHNAILYKVFIVDDHFQVVERPSLKNFYPEDCKTMKTIYFNSHDVSKSGSNSKWSKISKEEHGLAAKPKYEIFEKIVHKVKKIFGLLLVGVDVVIENHTEKYAIIDVNAFPGYDGYPKFFSHLVESIKKQLKEQSLIRQSNSSSFKKCLKDELFSNFENKDKKKVMLYQS